MELWQKIIACELRKSAQKEGVSSEIYLKEMLNNKCYKVLLEIKEILEADDLSDAECFDKIEQIVLIFESLGSGLGGRHDFG